MPGSASPLDIPFHNSLVSNDWKTLGYASERAARYWDTRSCGVACLRMVYAHLVPQLRTLPATITEELLRAGAYTEQLGWNHAALARHGQSNGLKARRLEPASVEELIDLFRKPGVLVVSIAPSFDEPGRSGHLAVLAGLTAAGQMLIHRPSSQRPDEGRNISVSPGKFWQHFSGRAIHFQTRQSES